MEFLDRTFSEGDKFKIRDYSRNSDNIYTVVVRDNNFFFIDGEFIHRHVNVYHTWEFVDKFSKILLNDEPIKLELK